MYEWPASIAPEPNNYEFISSSSRSIFFSSFYSTSSCCCCWLAEQRIHSDPASEQRPARHFLPAEKKSSRSARHTKSTRTWFSIFLRPQWLLYLFTAAFAERLASLCSSLCVNPAPEAEGRRLPPLPDGRWQATKTESCLSQSGRPEIQALLKATNQSAQ